MGRLVPTAWIGVLVTIFGCTRKLAVRLWPYVPATPDLLWRLSRVHDAGPQYGAWVECMRHLSETLTPAMFFAATLQVAPEGRRRDTAVIRLEESILKALDREGNWQW
jgi:hypothetical protein